MLLGSPNRPAIRLLRLVFFVSEYAEVNMWKSSRKSLSKNRDEKSATRARLTSLLRTTERPRVSYMTKGRKSPTAQRLRSPLVRSKADKSPLLRMTYKSRTHIMRAQDHARERLPSLLRLIRLRSMPIETGLQVLQRLRDPCKSAMRLTAQKSPCMTKG